MVKKKKAKAKKKSVARKKPVVRAARPKPVAKKANKGKLFIWIAIIALLLVIGLLYLQATGNITFRGWKIRYKGPPQMIKTSGPPQMVETTGPPQMGK